MENFIFGAVYMVSANSKYLTSNPVCHSCVPLFYALPNIFVCFFPV